METQNHQPRLKAIPGYEGLYSATRDGRIYRHARNGVKAGWVKVLRNTAYLQVPLNKNGKRSWVYVHRLVAMTFLRNPEYKPQVNHKNCNKHDNRVANLEWVTWKENWEHGRDHGKYKGIMLSDEQQFELYELYLQGGFTQRQLAELYGISKSSVYRYIIKQKQNCIKLAA